MSPAYVAGRVPQIELMLLRLADAKAENIRRSLVNPLTGRDLTERAVLFASRRNNEINDMITALTEERKRLSKMILDVDVI